MTETQAAKAIETLQHSIAPDAAPLSFIETQFPVSKMSVESYTERKAGPAQTLPVLGKWWGGKPLVLCRATILGLLLPSTEKPAVDRDVFLRLMTMDDDGLLHRKSKPITGAELFARLPSADRTRYFESDSTEESAKLRRGLSRDDKDALQRRVFLSLPYNKKMAYVCRPEQIDGPSTQSWKVINSHLGTSATSLPELVADLGKRRFGHVPRVGDSFCGRGSIPFEAARLGCEAYGSDLNPVAALLTWGALNIIGGGEKITDQVQKAQLEIFEAIDRQITSWGIEHRKLDPKTGRSWRADAYLYCIEATCPECGWRVPLAPSWVIGKGTKTIARLVRDSKHQRYDFKIEQGVTDAQVGDAAEAGTAKDSEMVCPQCHQRTPMRVIRGDGRGNFGDSKSLLRGWENDDLIPRDEDILGERLYCIRWVDPETGERCYAGPVEEDAKREKRVLELLRERFVEWQEKGYIPSRRIEPGYNTSQPIRERGWTHWHHLFTPRQLLLSGLFNSHIAASQRPTAISAGLTLMLGRVLDFNSRLCRWVNDQKMEALANTFSSQALNTLFNFAIRTGKSVDTSWLNTIKANAVAGASLVESRDARQVSRACDLWITDPPYADAINYHEITEFFLNWYRPTLELENLKFGLDTRRAVAVQGRDIAFIKAMVESYRKLAELMPINGFQVVMFTHQDAGVWADLALILWASGLCVSAAWCIATETGPATGEGNYVQGTVLLVLRKQRSAETAFLDEVYNEVEAEVRRQLDMMKDLDDASDPNFTDTDYQLAAYAAALRVLTGKKIEEIDVGYELTRTRARGEKSEVEKIIDKAVQIACDHLVPRGIEKHLWKSLTGMERFYLKGLEMESHGERRSGVYQELARGFGIDEYRVLLASTKANETRLKTASEFARKEMTDEGFGAALVRHALFAAFKTADTESTKDALNWLKTEVSNYASVRPRLIEILEFFASLKQNATMEHWHTDAHAAGLVAGAMRNREDHV